MISQTIYRVYSKCGPIKYILNITLFWAWLAIDQWINALTGGSPGETVSGRLARIVKGLGKKIKDWLNRIDKDHCKEWEVKRSPMYEVFNPWGETEEE